MKFMIVYRKDNKTVVKSMSKDDIRDLIARDNPTVLNWGDVYKGATLENYVGNVLVVVEANDIFDENLRLGNKW